MRDSGDWSFRGSRRQRWWRKFLREARNLTAAELSANFVELVHAGRSSAGKSRHLFRVGSTAFLAGESLEFREFRRMKAGKLTGGGFNFRSDWSMSQFGQPDGPRSVQSCFDLTGFCLRVAAGKQFTGGR